MKKINENEISVYVFRNTIEKEYDGEEILAKLYVDKEWLKEYVSKHSDMKFEVWLDFYTCKDTMSLYELASKENVIHKIEYGKPVVYEDDAIRSLSDLAYRAMRMLEIIGKGEEGEELFNRMTSGKEVPTYLHGKKEISKYVDVVLLVENLTEIRKCNTIMIYSELNDFIDFMIYIYDSDYFEYAQVIVGIAYDEWFANSEEVGDSTLIDYISDRLKAKEIEFDVYWKREAGEEVE